jgi:hypothetical protein
LQHEQRVNATTQRVGWLSARWKQKLGLSLLTSPMHDEISKKGHSKSDKYTDNAVVEESIRAVEHDWLEYKQQLNSTRSISARNSVVSRSQHSKTKTPRGAAAVSHGGKSATLPAAGLQQHSNAHHLQSDVKPVTDHSAASQHAPNTRQPMKPQSLFPAVAADGRPA